MTLDELINRLQEERRRLPEDVNVEIEAHEVGHLGIGDIFFDVGDLVLVITQEQQL